MDYSAEFPEQAISFKSKGDKWRRRCVDWATTQTYFTCADVRQGVVKMKVNYDLINGIIHMDDIVAILNPGDISTAFLPDKIQHYPIINSKLNTLRGEEASRAFDWRVIVTNPNAVTQIEEDKKAAMFADIQGIVEDQEISDDQARQQAQDTSEYYNYTWQDIRELRANELLKHYSKELNFKRIFNDGFMDALTSGWEVYEVGINGGEPFIARLNPMKLRVYGLGYSNHIEDADVIIYEDYWSRGRIIDVFNDQLTAEQTKRISNEYPDHESNQPVGAAGNYNEAFQFSAGQFYTEDGILIEGGSDFNGEFDLFPELNGGIGSSLMPYDILGNMRVLRVWWKSKRKILQVKSYDPITGEEKLDFYPETYIADKSAGEEVTPLWINEMWEGTKIGEDIYVNIRPCLVQHNSISNPSRCRCGIVGTIYNVNEMVPYSLVDMMKPYNYLYDAVHAKLVDLIATNWGKIMEMDLALKPKDYNVEQWLYFARVNKVLIKDSFNEGNKGAALGKLAGGLNNASKGYIDADWGQSIQNYMNILQWTKDSMSDLVGINRQREGNTYNRETVGGIERAVLQSSYITDWLFQVHDDTKKRTIESFIEESKGAMRGRNKKFQYILSDGSLRLLDVPGDEYCECDYGLVVDNSADTQKLNANLESIGQALAQNNFKASSIIRLYSTMSMQDKLRMIEKTEKQMEVSQQQAAEREQQLAQLKIQAEQQMKQIELQQKEQQNIRDNETKVKVAEIGAQAEYLRLGIYENQNNEQLRRDEMQIDIDKLEEERRQFDLELRQSQKELETKKMIEFKKIEAQNSKNKNAN